MFKILIIEDDYKIRQIILEHIEKWGFEGLSVEEFNNILTIFLKYSPHLILLDINLPAFDGFYWCKKIREISEVPIIFISSRTSNMDIIMAINQGGDDYIQKPFSMEVLISKINALLRRAYSYRKAAVNAIEYQGVILNLPDNQLLYQEQKLELTKNEFKIMLVLMKNKGTIVKREQIMQSLWEDESFIDDNTLTVNINRLRKKLSQIGLSEFIQTRKGQGYMIL
ncbi:MAG: response regulator transcription factor [Halanaerobiales bacterium]|nr:response regulator transcription factor [Halanaerobiales bacterium]